jgi:hypothetical protein
MKSDMKTISARNNVFFQILKNFDFYDISKFWKIPYKQILKEVKQIPEEHWRKPFNGEGDQVQRMKLDDTNSVNYYPGIKNENLIQAHGWKTLCFLNETGDSKDQITRFPPTFKNSFHYKDTLKNFKNNRKWTNIEHFSPTLKLFFKNVVEKYMIVGQIYITKLEKGGVVTEHTDIPDKEKNKINSSENLHNYDILNTFNLSLNNVDSCYSIFNKQIMPSYEGCLMWTNIGKPHWVVNMNKDTQYKLIWQGIYTKEFRKLILEKFKSEIIDMHPNGFFYDWQNEKMVTLDWIK